METRQRIPAARVPRASGCKNAFDQLFFPRVPLARKGHAASVSGRAANGCAIARSKEKKRFGRNFARMCKVAVRGSA